MSFYNNIFKQIMPSKQPNYTDKRTGIVYANNIGAAVHVSDAKAHPYLDAFIPDSFLKTYFGNGKSI